MDRNRPYDEEQCTAELAIILEESPRVRLLLSNVFKLNNKALVKGVTCRKCKGTLQDVCDRRLGVGRLFVHHARAV